MGNSLTEWFLRGGITVLLSLFGYYWLPSSPQNARWFTPAEKEVARTRALRDGSKVVDEKFNFNLAFQQWKDPKMILWSFISLTYPIPFTTSANFLPQVRTLRFCSLLFVIIGSCMIINSINRSSKGWATARSKPT